MLQELHGVIFRVPNLAVEEYQTADAYLSGNVRAKLREARALAAIDPCSGGLRITPAKVAA